MNPDLDLAQPPALLTPEHVLEQPADLHSIDVETGLDEVEISQPEVQSPAFAEVPESLTLQASPESTEILEPASMPVLETSTDLDSTEVGTSLDEVEISQPEVQAPAFTEVPESLSLQDSPILTPDEASLAGVTSSSLEQAKVQLQVGAYEEAVSSLRQQLRQTPNDHELQQLLGEAYLLRANLSASKPSDSNQHNIEQTESASDSNSEPMVAEPIAPASVASEAISPEFRPEDEAQSQTIKTLNEVLQKQEPEVQQNSPEIQTLQSITTYEGYWKVNSKAFQSITEELQFRINNSDTLQHLKVGTELYEKEGIEDVRNIPIRAGIEGKVNDFHLAATVGVDVFQESETTPYLELKARTQLTPNLNAFGTVRYERYKDDASVIENQVSRWKLAPAIYWQLDPQTSLYAGYDLNHYSDNNIEQEATLEATRELGNFFISALGFYESFSDTTTSKYFAPSSYWLYSGEVGWKGKVNPQSQLQLSATMGQQHYPVGPQEFWSLKASWQQQVSKHADLELKYRYSRQAPYPGNTQDEHEHSLFVKAGIRF